MAENYIIPKQTLTKLLEDVEYLFTTDRRKTTQTAMQQILEDFRATYINIPDTHQHLWGVQESSNGTTTIYCTTCGVTKQLGKSYTKIFSMDKSPTFSCANCGRMVDVVHLYAGHLICIDCADRYDPGYTSRCVFCGNAVTVVDPYSVPVICEICASSEENHAHVWILEPNERWFVCAICGTTE